MESSVSFTLSGRGGKTIASNDVEGPIHLVGGKGKADKDTHSLRQHRSSRETESGGVSVSVRSYVLLFISCGF